MIIYDAMGVKGKRKGKELMFFINPKGSDDSRTGNESYRILAGAANSYGLRCNGEQEKSVLLPRRLHGNCLLGLLEFFFFLVCL